MKTKISYILRQSSVVCCVAGMMAWGGGCSKPVPSDAEKVQKALETIAQVASNQATQFATETARIKYTNCVSHLKILGVAFRSWALDHNDKFPYNLTTNSGGTLELCQRGEDGYDSNTASHFAAMGGEIVKSEYLICPADSSKLPAEDTRRLTGKNVSYKMRTGSDVDDAHPDEVLLRCPIHGHILYCDGHVKEGDGK